MANEVAAGPGRPIPSAPRRPGAGRHWILAPETAIEAGAGRLSSNVRSGRDAPISGVSRLSPVVLATGGASSAGSSDNDLRGGSVERQTHGGGRPPPQNDPWADYLSGDPWDGNDDVLRECQEEWCADFLVLQRSQRVPAEVNAKTMPPEGHEIDKPSVRRFSTASLSTVSGGSSSVSSSTAPSLRPSTAFSGDASQVREWQIGLSPRMRGTSDARNLHSNASPLRQRGSLYEAVALAMSPNSSPVASPVANRRSLRSSSNGAMASKMPRSGQLTSRSSTRQSFLAPSFERRRATLRS